MTLRQLIDAHPEAFYGQTWYDDERFLDREGVGVPKRLDATGHASVAEAYYSAADLAAYWLRNPDDPVWAHYLWTSDFDNEGQRVYVGQNGRGLEIHRHLHLTDRWVVPT